MSCIRLSIENPRAPSEARAKTAAGETIAFPTDTVWGVGAAINRPMAVKNLYALKGRTGEKALPVLLGDAGAWTEVASAATQDAQRLMDAFWPGPLTIILDRRAEITQAIGSQTETIAVRFPAHPALCRVLQATGPLASSSANRSGDRPLRDGDAVEALLGHSIGLILDDVWRDPIPSPSLSSTVVDVRDGNLHVLREGALSREMLFSALANH